MKVIKGIKRNVCSVKLYTQVMKQNTCNIIQLASKISFNLITMNLLC